MDEKVRTYDPVAVLECNEVNVMKWTEVDMSGYKVNWRIGEKNKAVDGVKRKKRSQKVVELWMA